MDRLENIITDQICIHCKFSHLTLADIDRIWSYDICSKCNIMRIKQPQRFGRLVKSFGDYGELRKQKKPPQLEVFYIPIEAVNEKSKIQGQDTVLRSVNNCTSDQITTFIRKVGLSLEAKAISQVNAEIVLDHCYAEIHKRVVP